jgi:hypothetical protein
MRTALTILVLGALALGGYAVWIAYETAPADELGDASPRRTIATTAVEPVTSDYEIPTAGLKFRDADAEINSATEQDAETKASSRDPSNPTEAKSLSFPRNPLSIDDEQFRAKFGNEMFFELQKQLLVEGLAAPPG